MPKGGLVAGDGGSLLRVHILDSETNEPIDLTGKTVMLRFSLAGGATVEKTMTALDQTTNKGWATYQFAAADLPQGGELQAETRLNDGQPDQLTSDRKFKIPVRDPLP